MPGFITCDITGICSMCGEIILFGNYHHIFGNGKGFTVILCNECHYQDGMKVKDHCLSIGRRIEYGTLCYY